MDVYHNADIFVRRMLYKPTWWKQYFSSESDSPTPTTIVPSPVDSSKFYTKIIPYDQNENRVDNCNCNNAMVKVKFADIEKNTNRRNSSLNIKKQLVKVKMADVAVKQKSKIVTIEKASTTDIYKTINSFYLNSNNQKSYPIGDSVNSSLNTTDEQESDTLSSKEQDLSNTEFEDCPFQQYSSDSPPSPIPLSNKIKFICKDRVRKPNTSINKVRKMSNNRNKYSKLLNDEDVPRSADGKIIKDLVLERFIAKVNSGIISAMRLTDNERNLVNENLSKNDTASTYDADKFLEMALGEEMNSSHSISVSDVHIKQLNNKEDKSTSNDSFTDNELTSICTADASALISEREIPSVTINFQLPKETQDENISSDYMRNKRITALMQQAAEQHYHMQQASKALSICRITKEFMFSEERLEAERLLLLAVTKNRAILDEVNRLDLADNTDNNLQLGNITISDICVPLNDIKTNISLQKRFDNFSQWFLLIASCESQVYASKILTPDSNLNLSFNESMSFHDLPPDFSLIINIYYLEQPKNVRNFSHESKYHLDKHYTCPTPKKFFKKHVCKQVPNVNRITLNDYIRTPAFKLAGHLKINLNNLNKTEVQRELKQVHTYLRGVLTMKVRTNLQINVTHQGFLTFGSMAGGYPSWSRHWSILDGHYLKYWNYPSEVDTKDPVGIINLKECVTAWIDTVDNEICSKPRTLLLETKRQRQPNDEDSLILKCIDDEHTIVRHLLSCDTESDLKQWAKQLNLVVSYLRNWNLIEKN